MVHGRLVSVHCGCALQGKEFMLLCASRALALESILICENQKENLNILKICVGWVTGNKKFYWNGLILSSNALSRRHFVNQNGPDLPRDLKQSCVFMKLLWSVFLALLRLCNSLALHSNSNQICKKDFKDFRDS